jgi:hypothetical protein
MNGRPSDVCNRGLNSSPRHINLCRKPSRSAGLKGMNIMDTQTLLIIVILILLLGGGGWYGRGRWF